MSDISPCLAGITVAILAGGLGTRLRPAVTDRPKVLADVHGRPFLATLLDQIDDAGCQQVVLCTGYLGKQVQSALGDKYRNLSLRYSQESVQLGTAGALRLALPHLASDPVLVMNGDSVCVADLNSFFQWHSQKRAEASLLLTHVPDVQRYGQIQVNDEGVVLVYKEKGAACGSGWINAGIYLIARHMLEVISEGQFVSIEKEIFPTWIGHGLYGYQSNSRFLDIGTPQSYQQASDFLQNNCSE